ncbi:enoyl-CoA hydratase/isomerase family protein [Sulfitobacter sp. W027]|uniref:enoyl-CoA hydratase/isomerase family protein n=1 Tax=Sulfitobacter sp. W027 TaxID=2867025 RepID=UPI0021A4A57B|nr:enoyl-CoA hydratase/isomerase family protein [Sulfitobacter sp. W027]UWR32111.1 enoyl-CoA hydratase/isomerase family protein [Sulfitobacter sp. W027]
MSDISIRKSGRAGRITLTRPKALNALSYDMCIAIEKAIDNWRNDPEVAVIVLDAVGEKAFCAGGDVAQLYETGKAGDFDFARRFWADEYRLNNKLHGYPKPVISFMQGFTMGGGVGIGCHGSHRVVGESSKIAMPECGIGLVPDVGGTLLLAQAPGRMGEYLGLTGARMGANDVLHAGFADYFIPEAKWPNLIAQLEENGDPFILDRAATTPPPSKLAEVQGEVDHLFNRESLSKINAALSMSDSDFAVGTLKTLRRNSPLSMACTLEMLRRLRGPGIGMVPALAQEYRFTARSLEKGDFIEGVRAAIIDKDRSPNWQHADWNVPHTDIDAMLASLGDNELKLEENS